MRYFRGLKLLSLAILLLFAIPQIADAGFIRNSRARRGWDFTIGIQTEDGTVKINAPRILKVTDGDLTKNPDGSASLNTAGSGNPATADITDVNVTQTEFEELETIGDTTISTEQWATLGGIANTLSSTELNLLDGITTLSGSNTGDDDVPESGDFGNADDLNADGTITDGVIDAADYAGDIEVRSIGITIDGGGSAITTGQKGYIEAPYACTIKRVTLLLDQSGSIVVDIWKDSFANYPPTDADSITASAVPTVSTATKSQDATLTGWTTSVTAGDILGFNVDSITTTERAHLILKCDMT